MPRPILTHLVAASVVIACAARPVFAAPADDARRMATTKYQFQPSRAALIGDGISIDLDATADPVARLSDAVAAGRWGDVAQVIAGLPPTDAPSVHHQIIASLVEAGPRAAGPDALRAEDVLGLASALPTSLRLPPADVAALGQLWGRATAVAGPSAAAQAMLEKGGGRFGNASPEQRTETAAMFLAAGDLSAASRYLPDVDSVEKANDASLDRVYFRYAIAAADAADKAYDVESAVRLRSIAFRLVLRSMLRPDGATPDAVVSTFELARQTDRTQTLLDALRPLVQAGSPALRPILAAAAAVPPPANTADSAAARAIALRMQHDLADMIVDALPADARADDARVVALNTFAANWTAEAQLAVAQWRDGNRAPPPAPAARGRGGPGQQQQSQDQAPARGITAELLWTRAPLGKWRDRITGQARAALDRELVCVAMYVDDADASLAILADLAKSYPASDDVVGDALELWAKQRQPLHVDPLLANSSYQSPGIPLTRAAQDRNVDGLVAIIARLNAIYGRPVAVDRLPKLFDAVHSQAEVYSLVDIERVFGTVNSLDTQTLMRVCDLMFGNLQNDWLFPSVQAVNGTGRSEDDTYKMVLAGYDTLAGLLDAGAKRSPDADVYRRIAAVRFQQADVSMALNLGYGVYNADRAAAFVAMRQAATLGGDATPEAYANWFARALGAEKVTKVTSRSIFADDQLAAIKLAIDGLPSGRAANAREAVLNAVRAQLDALRPDARYRVVTAALQVAGNDPTARGLKTLSRYYGDLLQDVGVSARVDGTPQVGTQPFGLIVTLRHTDRLERQVHGFAKYVQNKFQNTSRTPGRPGSVMSYRDELEKHVRAALAPAYDVQSILWAPADVTSHAGEQPDWRETPLCYVIAKAKDATADRVPPVQIDLDFADALNEIVLPVESGTLVVDATRADPRPVGTLHVEQTINDHDARDGKLEWTVDASGDGLMPPLDRVVDLAGLGELQATDVQDAGPQADRFDTDGVAPRVVSHRKWVVTLTPKAGSTMPAVFAFPQLAASAKDSTVAFKKYSDADIVEATPRVALAGIASPARSNAWIWAIGSAIFVTVAALAAFLRLRRRRPAGVSVAPARPKSNPFDLLADLQQMHRAPGNLTADERMRLSGDIVALERHYFGKTSGDDAVAGPDVATIAGRWH